MIEVGDLKDNHSSVLFMHKSQYPSKRTRGCSFGRLDLDQMVRIKVDELIFSFCIGNIKNSKKLIMEYAALVQPLKALLHSVGCQEKELRKILEIERQLEDRVYILASQANEQLSNGRIKQAVKLYELSVGLSQARIGIICVEELDIVDYLAHCYLKQGQYAKALRAFRYGPSQDKGYKQVLEFCANFFGEKPQTLRTFLRKYQREKQSKKFSPDVWSLGS